MYVETRLIASLHTLLLLRLRRRDILHDMPNCLALDGTLHLPAKLDQVILKFEGQQVFLDMDDPEVVGVRFNKMMVFFQFFNRVNTAGRNFKFDTCLLDLLFGIVDHIAGEHRTIGDKDDIVIFIEQGGFGNIDVKDLAPVITDLDMIINGDFLAETDHDATDDICEEIF